MAGVREGCRQLSTGGDASEELMQWKVPLLEKKGGGELVGKKAAGLSAHRLDDLSPGLADGEGYPAKGETLLML